MLWFAFALLAGSIVAFAFSLNALWQTFRTGLPFVVSPQWFIDWLRENLSLTKNDTVYELGCGDARILTALAKAHPETTFIGIELQWWPFVLAKWRTRNQKNISIIHGDIFQRDLRSATVVFGFFITNFMDKLQKKVRTELRAGTKVISYGFQFDDWTPRQVIANPRKTGGSKIQIYHV